MRLARLTSVCACCILAGCSAVQLAYNHADWWLLRTANNYLALSGAQKEYLRSELATRLEEHRREELEAYVAFFDNAATAAAQNLTSAGADALIGELQSALETTVANTVPVFTPVMAELSEDQIDHLTRRMEDRNREYRENYLQGDRDERLQDRAKRTLRRVERWTGSLSRQQRQLVMGISRSWPELAEDWYDYRTAQQAGLLSLLRNRAAPDQIAVYLTDWWVGQAGLTPRLRQAVGHTRQGFVKLLLALDASLTPEQRDHFVRRATGFRDDLRGLLPAEHPLVAQAGPFRPATID